MTGNQRHCCRLQKEPEIVVDVEGVEGCDRGFGRFDFFFFSHLPRPMSTPKKREIVVRRSFVRTVLEHRRLFLVVDWTRGKVLNWNDNREGRWQATTPRNKTRRFGFVMVECVTGGDSGRLPAFAGLAEFSRGRLGRHRRYFREPEVLSVACPAHGMAQRDQLQCCAGGGSCMDLGRYHRVFPILRCAPLEN